MKKVFFLMLTLFILSTASMNAQVRIGGLDDPNPSAVLDLNANNDAVPTDNKGGLSLPRINLSSETVLLNGTVPPNGTVVYNTGGDLNEGIYYWTGGTSGQWVYVSGLIPKITTQPARFTFGRLYDESGDPDAPAFTEKKLTVVASGPGLTYQWYQKTKNPNAVDTKLTGNDVTAPTYTFSVPTEGVANWGLYQYYCVVSNAYGSVKSDLAEIAVGCGAKTATGGWLKFMCHNLGASPVGSNQSLDDITFASNGSGYGGPDTISTDAKGWLFQWGRAADGHQWRGTSNNAITGPYESEMNIDVPSGHEMYGKYIRNNAMATAYDWRSPQYDIAWRNWNDGRFPCPAGWKIPSSSDWSTLYRLGPSYGTAGEATSNTWIWENKGYGIRPDGVTTSLFLPAVGCRVYNSGALRFAAQDGNYWSSETHSQGAYCLLFNENRVSACVTNYRAVAAGVRCVSESE
jgi:uncharacterized protein (TIGR02145 family)